jgi:pyrimidine operon attenuation protein/uracil phosphoribosyltransferase
MTMRAAHPLDAGHRLLDEGAMTRTLTRLAHEIIERHPALDNVVLAGVRTRGVPIAMRMARLVGALGAAPPRVGALELAAYRDDRPRAMTHRPGALSGPDGGDAPPIDDHTVIVVDDVLFTGRTLRCALDALTTEGRASSVELLVVIDRGHRELPMRATYVGKNVPTSPVQHVRVRLRDTDGIEGAWLVGDS